MPADAPAAPRAFDALKAIAAVEPVGLTDARRRFRAEAIAIARAQGLGRAHMTYAIVALDAPAADILRAGGEAFHAPRMLPETGELTALAFGVCTIGPALVEKVRALFAERKMSLALALDTLGSGTTEAVDLGDIDLGDLGDIDLDALEAEGGDDEAAREE